jgi:hypothetical protein
MRIAGHVARVGEKRNTYWVLVGKPEGKRPLARWEHNIKVGLKSRVGSRQLDSSGSG